MPNDQIEIAIAGCCVFPPVNRCFAHRSMVKIFFLDRKRQKKLVLTQNQMISTSERHAEHLFAGRNTQQLVFDIEPIIDKYSFL